MNAYLVIATVIISLIAEFNRPLKQRLMFNAYDIKHHNEWWRFVTGGFVHADFNSGLGVAHLAFNMLALWSFGDYAETFFQNLVHNNLTGSILYLVFYVVAIPMSSLYSFEKHKNDQWYNALGASGAISAVMFCFILQYPFARLGLMFIPLPVPAFVIGILYLGISWFMARKGGDNIGHDAHFFGAVFGILVTVLSSPRVITQYFGS